MNLRELLFGKVDAPPHAPSKPAPVKVSATPASVCAVTSGELIPIQEIPDPIFASGAMGPAVGIKPTDGIIYAPVTGMVTVMTSTLHALGMTSDDGIEVLIHAGVDTVNLRGEGFHGFVRKGQHVRAGEPLMVYDLDKIRRAGYSDVAITVIINASSLPEVSVTSEGQVKAGETVMRIGG